LVFYIAGSVKEESSSEACICWYRW